MCRVNLQRFVSPNPGFELQLQLYERMRFTIDCTNLQYKVYRLKLAARKIRKGWFIVNPQIDKINMGINEGNCVSGGFLDIRKVYATVYHSLLLEKYVLWF